MHLGWLVCHSCPDPHPRPARTRLVCQWSDSGCSHAPMGMHWLLAHLPHAGVTGFLVGIFLPCLQGRCRCAAGCGLLLVSKCCADSGIQFGPVCTTWCDLPRMAIRPMDAILHLVLHLNADPCFGWGRLVRTAMGWSRTPCSKDGVRDTSMCCWWALGFHPFEGIAAIQFCAVVGLV